MEEAHNLGFALRDIKPDNILINHEGQVLLCDFGLVAPFGDIDSSICGTPEYMAPERLSKRRSTLPIQPEIDYWSLGVLAFELLMGYTPYAYVEDDLDGLLESMYGGYISFD
jgi:serine/threonine protein kinase